MEDPFVPTSEDLAGFWDMVYLQVEHINSLFADLVELRKNDWIQKVIISRIRAVVASAVIMKKSQLWLGPVWPDRAILKILCKKSSYKQISFM